MADVALIMSRNQSEEARSLDKEVNNSLYYLKGALEGQGISTEVITPFSNEHYSTQEILEKVARSEAKAIGISATSQYSQDVLEYSWRLKQFSNVPVVLGGYISLLGKKVMDSVPYVDVLFKGEGEIRVSQLFRALIEGTNYDNIPGLIYRKGHSLYDTGKAPQVPKKVLGEVLPDISYLGLLEPDNRIAEIYSARGCYNACSFCSIRAMNGKGVRAMPKKALQGLIEDMYQKYQPTEIGFSDDNFLFKSGRLNDIAKVVRKYGLKIRFQTRADDVLRYQREIIRNKDFISLVSVGVESFSESQLRRWMKNVYVWENIRAIQIMSENKITVRPYFMFVDSKTTHDELKENFRTYLRLPLFDGKVPHHIIGLTRGQRIPINPLADIYGYGNLPDNLTRIHTLLNKTNNQLNLFQSYNDIFTKGLNLDIKDQKASIVTLIKSSVALYLTAVWGAHPEIGVAHAGIKAHEELRDNVVKFERLVEHGNMGNVANFARDLEERVDQILKVFTIDEVA